MSRTAVQLLRGQAGGARGLIEARVGNVAMEADGREGDQEAVGDMARPEEGDSVGLAAQLAQRQGLVYQH